MPFLSHVRAAHGFAARRARQARQRPRPGGVDFGDLDGTTPISRRFGFDRGAPIDRWYIERFLAEHSSDIHGRVLEVADNAYTTRFGSDVARSDVLHARGGEGVTIVGDLATGDGIPSEAFDAIVLTQTLNVVYEIRDVISVLHRALAHGGVLLTTTPGIAQLSRYDADRWGDFWRFTSQSLERLLAEQFGAENVMVQACGNVKAAVGLLHGLAVEDLADHDLEPVDRDYEVVLLARAARD
jgi:SAM-dependent methyltransferase